MVWAPRAETALGGSTLVWAPRAGFLVYGVERVLGFPLQPRGLAPHKKKYRLLLRTACAVFVSSWCCCYEFGTGVVAGSLPLVAGATLSALAFVLVTVLPYR